MIDSHCHLNFQSLSKDLPNIIKRCKKNNVTHLLSINTKPQDFVDAALEFSADIVLIGSLNGEAQHWCYNIRKFKYTSII